ncbi:hypothetical protein [uncultured Acinetobacter sp.]|jgi:hypothetical protein|uniref:hypothetical protein n=1 Tax=uncultured Acinetobacter sp. TaxID=165433 RepID=UPI002636A706|nr:hypothetical protein [uncultured Acinetobacter sp.]
MMMTLEQVQKALQDRNLKAVASGCGLAYDTVWRIANGKIERVSYDAVKALSDYLQQGAAING